MSGEKENAQKEWLNREERNDLPFRHKLLETNMKKLTKEEKERRLILLNILSCGIIIVAAGCIIDNLLESNRELASRNKKLEIKNATLKGRNKSLKDENKRLVKENYEACYHLGKKSISHPRTRIRIKIKR